MAWFGSFDCVAEVYSDSIYTVYSARKRGDPVTEYAIKLFRLTAEGSQIGQAVQARSPEEVRKELSSRIQVQQCGAVASAFIAPILESGQDARGVWYATNFYHRAANKIMLGSVALPRASLEHVIRSIARGALDLKRACGRSHGDIRLTSIQLSTEHLTEAQVVLSDPLPGDAGSAAAYELNDLHAIGAILLQLVRQRLLTPDDPAFVWPVNPSSKWKRVFGENWRDWLEICNLLLDPNLSLEQFNLERLCARLEQPAPKGGSSPKVAVAIGGMAVVLAILLWWLWPRSGAVVVTSDPPGASVRLDEAKDCGITPLLLRLNQGDHVIEARHDKFGLAELATNCVVGSHSTRIDFQFPYGLVGIRSQPAGATVLRKGVVVGMTPADDRSLIIPAPPGPVTYGIKLEQYELTELAGVVVPSETIQLSAQLQRARAQPVAGQSTNATGSEVSTNAAVELRAAPGPAVIVDAQGNELGRASVDVPLVLRLTPGEYSFTARMEGLADVTGKLNVSVQGPNQDTFVFRYGTVTWNAEPQSATVSVGAQVRSVPATFLQRPWIPTTYVVSAPGYRSWTNEVTVKRGEEKKLATTLEPEPVLVEAASNPPGALLTTEDGIVLSATETNKALYVLPWGPTTVVARISGLEAVTNHVELAPGAAGTTLQFNFDYGTLVLTNLPSEVAVFEGETRVGSPGEKWVYQRPGKHLYALRGGAHPELVRTNIQQGLNFLRLGKAEKFWKNSLGIWFAWVPGLPGGGVWPGQEEPGGWVGITEVTQGQFKKMDGQNPSAYRDGGDNYPVENLTWAQAMVFCRWLSAKDTALHFDWQYTVPAEEQFATYAADADQVQRVTNEGRMTNPMEDITPLQRTPRIPAAANLNNPRTHPEQVGSTKQPNRYGLYDVVGNVSEWTWRSGTHEPISAGGSYLNFSPKTVGTKARERGLHKGPNIGFRIVLIP